VAGKTTSPQPSPERRGSKKNNFIGVRCVIIGVIIILLKINIYFVKIK